MASNVLYDCKTLVELRFGHLVCHLLKPGDFVNTSVRKVLHCLQSVGAAECFSKELCKRSEMDKIKGHCSAHPNGLYSSLLSHDVITKTQYVHQYQC